MTRSTQRRRLPAGLAATATAVAVAAVALTACTSPSPSSSTRAAQPPAQPSPASSGLVAGIVSGQFTTKTPEPAFVRAPHDDAGHVSYEVGTLKITPPSSLPVYLIGGSNVRECIATPKALEAAIRRDAGVATTVVDLGSSNQHLGESMAIVDNLPKGPGIVVVSVNHSRFAYSPAEIARQIQGFTLLMPSPALHALMLRLEGKAPRATIAPGVAAYFADWRKRNAAALAAGTTPRNVYRTHKYTASHILSAATDRGMVTKWLTGKGGKGGPFDSCVQFDVKVLRGLVALAQKRGFKVVLMEASANDAIIGTSFAPYRKVYVPQCRRVAAESGAVYVDPNLTAHLTTSEFFDLTHLVGTGRTKWTTALAALLTPTVKALKAGTP